MRLEEGSVCRIGWEEEHELRAGQMGHTQGLGPRPNFEAPESSQCDDDAVALQVVSFGDLFHPQRWEPGLLQGVHQHVAWHGPP